MVSTTRAATAGTATFQIQVIDASLNANLDAAIAIGASSGASTANLAGVSASISQGFVVSRFDFNVTVPAAECAATRDKLIAAQRALATSSSQAIGWTVSYNWSGPKRKQIRSRPRLGAAWIKLLMFPCQR
jgi:hypothetical protein